MLSSVNAEPVRKILNEADEKIVTELMPYFDSAKPLVRKATLQK
jgi:hypothetical protein